MSRDELPDYMLEFTSEPREEDVGSFNDVEEITWDGEGQSETYHVDCWRREDYGRFRVALSSGRFYLIDLENEVYERFDGKDMHKIRETIQGLNEKGLEAAKEDVYYSKANNLGEVAADRLDTFEDEDGFSEEDIRNLKKISEDWMPSVQDEIVKEVEEDYRRFNKEGFRREEILEIFEDTYGLSTGSIRRRVHDADIEY